MPGEMGFHNTPNGSDSANLDMNLDMNQEQNDVSKESVSASHQSILNLVTIFAGYFDFQSSIWDLPPLQRGWVIQERLMAPRTVYFGKDRIYWDFEEILSNEYLPWGLPGSGIEFDLYYLRRFSLPPIVSNDTPNQVTRDDTPILHNISCSNSWSC